MSNFLLTSEGKKYLDDQYIKAERSTHDIAEELGTNPNKIRRALMHHNLPLRTRSDAQKKALEHGRHNHPTKDTKRDKVTKQRISATRSARWDSLTDDERKVLSDIAKKQWEGMSADHKQNMQLKAAEAIRKAALEGSILEKYLFAGIIEAGYYAEFHKEFLTTREKTHVDIYLPDLRTAVEVDGLSHFVPIWGQENLERTQRTDQAKNGLLLEKGIVVVRVKHTVKNLSDSYQRKMLNKLLWVLEGIKNNFPDESNRLVYVEV